MKKYKVIIELETNIEPYLGGVSLAKVIGDVVEQALPSYIMGRARCEVFNVIVEEQP